MSDANVVNHGSIVVIVGVSAAGKCWLEEHLDQEGQRWGEGYVVEPRYVQDIVDGMRDEGLDVTGAMRS